MYLALKLLHIFAVVLFLGNIIIGIYWKLHGDRTRNPRIIAHTIEGIIATDRLFTVPGVILILIGGFGAAGIGRLPMLHTPWILWSIILFTISGIAFMTRLVPVQRQLLAVAQAGIDGGMDWERYKKLSDAWKLWGLVALLTPLAATVLMVMKPQ